MSQYRSMLTQLFMILFLLSLPSPATAQIDEFDKFTYHNDRFGFSFDFPSGFIPEGPPQNGDGRIFRTNDGQIQIIASAAFLTLGDFEEERNNSVKFRIQEGDKLSYSPAGENWFVLSGTTASGLVFYERSILTKDCDDNQIRATVILEYPDQLKKWIDPMVGWITKSLDGC